jgi:membrane protein YqaA with SNARE-associated domain
MFKKIYHKLHALAQHEHAVYYLIGLSFLESFCSPITPLVVLIPMVLAMPDKSWRFVNIATVASTVGSVIGYYIGSELIHIVQPWIEKVGYAEHYSTAAAWYDKWDVLALFISSIFPIPFKLFTIIAGVMQSDFMVFLITVVVVRWLHFALIPISIHWLGTPVVRWLKRKYS